MKKFLVTGGCGFIGSHLVEYLASKGDKIYIIDDLSSGHISNIEHINGDIIFFHSTVQNFDYSNLDSLDAVFHLAAQASVPYSIENFVESSSKNMMSTFKIIDFCSKYELPFIYASSSAVYGNLPFGDETNEVQLLSPYAADKYSMEIYARADYNLKNNPSFGLRFFNVYGPRQDPNSPYSGVISIFIDRLLKNLPISVNGGYQTRDFVFVTDVVNCLYRSYEFLTSNKGFHISNVLTGKSISISDMLNIIEENLKVKAEIIYKELPIGDPEISLGSTSNMESLLAIELERLIDVNAGISLTIGYNK